MRAQILLASLAMVLAACSGGGSTTNRAPKGPYVSLPLDQLPANTTLEVRGNHTGWIRDRTLPQGQIIPNRDGQKLQRLNTTGTPGQYEAVFRNNIVVPSVNYGRAVITMPANGQTVSATTDLGYKFTLTRSNDTLVYTLTGLFSMANQPTPTSNRYAYGGFAAGSYTPVGDLPALAATYTGSFLGYSSTIGQVTGNASINVDFTAATQQINGTVTGITNGTTGINDIAVLATIAAPAAGPDAAFASGGIVKTTSTATGQGAFPINTIGSVEGGFYGPAAEEIGITLRLVNATNILTGSIGGVRP